MDKRLGHWNEVGEASGKRAGEETGGGVPRSRKGFGHHVRQARARPRDTAIRDLLSDEIYTVAVHGFLAAARAGTVGEGVEARMQMGISVLFFPFLSLFFLFFLCRGRTGVAIGPESR